MTIGAAFSQFFNSFGIPAYSATSVPDKAVMPYITYPLEISSFDDGIVILAVNVWYRTESEAIPTAKAMEIGEAIGRGGCLLYVDGGYIWLNKGSPFIRAIQDEDNSVKRRGLNISAEFFT